MNEILLQKVKDYFSFNMSPEEQLQFEKEVKSDQELATIVDLYQTIENGMDDIEENPEEEAALRDSLKKLHEQYFTNERHHESEAKDSKVRRMSVWKILAIAALFISIIALCVIWLVPERKSSQDIATKNEIKKQPGSTIEDTSHPQVNRTDENTALQEKNKPPQSQDSIQSIQLSIIGKEKREALYANNFKADKTPASIPYLLQEALDLYKKQEYSDAIAAIDIQAIQTSIEEHRPRGMLDNEQQKEEKLTLFYAHYYKAISHMAKNKTEKAIPELRNALNYSPDKFWQGKTQWYLALANLKTGKVKEAVVLLKQVSNTSQSREYKQKALKLMDELPVQ